MFQYFTELTASRRANPTDDLASTIANATHQRRTAPTSPPCPTTRSSPRPGIHPKGLRYTPSVSGSADQRHPLPYFTLKDTLDG